MRGRCYGSGRYRSVRYRSVRYLSVRYLSVRCRSAPLAVRLFVLAAFGQAGFLAAQGLGERRLLLNRRRLGFRLARRIQHVETRALSRRNPVHWGDNAG